ncbi:hypothetical protein C9374_011710 [Naegleria lovaniensis]|uniref:Uncharacterized protein n=1 Tax=Naegleria lovaniensis TaxID=51637 RepID=A0AA88GE78_NAELO|nr:uncharacterized protein C9374_011710 [Naegleria lovaniensis]KAG2373825.1 hypothetical protein C9374_011710 [Naegleria lovaniensis]
MSHFERLFELLLEKQQEASDRLNQEIIQERSILWNEQIIPKIEQLFNQNRENHLQQFLQERKDDPSNISRNKNEQQQHTILRDLFSRDEEKEYRKRETQNIIFNQFGPIFDLIKKENQSLRTFSSFIPRGDSTKLFLKIPTKLDTENQIQQILENVENDMKKDYVRNGQLKDYENAKFLISNLKERNVAESVSSLKEIQEKIGDEEVMEESIFSRDIQMRKVMEDFCHLKFRLKVVNRAQNLLYTRIKMRYHYSFERILKQPKERISVVAWLQRETFLEQFENEIRNVSSMKKLYSQEFDISLYSSDSIHVNSNCIKELNAIIELGNEKITSKTLGYSIYILAMILGNVKIKDVNHVTNSLAFMFRIVMKFLLSDSSNNLNLFRPLPLRMKQLIYSNLLEFATHDDETRSSFIRHLISVTESSMDEDDDFSRRKRLYFVKYLCRLYVNKNNKHTELVLDMRKIEQALLHYCFCEDMNSSEVYFTNNTQDFTVMKVLYNVFMSIDKTALHHVRVLKEFVFADLQQSSSDNQYSIWNLIQQSLQEVFDVFEQACSVQISQLESQFEYCIKYACQRIIELVMGRNVRCFRFIDEWFALLLSCYEAIQKENEFFAHVETCNDQRLKCSNWLGMIEHVFQRIAQT